MTNLMLSTIGVLLAAAAVLMVTFYGGEAFFIGSQKAEASRLTVEGAQIEQAVTNFTIRYGRAPGNGGTHDEAMSELMSKKFLASAPRGGGEPWVIDYGNGLSSAPTLVHRMTRKRVRFVRKRGASRTSPILRGSIAATDPITRPGHFLRTSPAVFSSPCSGTRGRCS